MASLFSTIGGDLRAKARHCYGGDRFRQRLKVLLTDGTAAMIWYRLMQWSARRRLAPLAMVFNKINAVFCRCVIGRGADFGPEFVLVHSDGVFINSATRGGSRVFVEHQVTIGSESLRGEAPRLGSGIFIGAGAKIVGDVTIGDNARIGANSVVLKDVPANGVAIGVPARIVGFAHPNAGASAMSASS